MKINRINYFKHVKECKIGPLSRITVMTPQSHFTKKINWVIFNF